MVRELPGAAAKIQGPPTVDVGQERQQIGMLHGPLPAGAESFERRIAREEPGVVVDVLRVHAFASFALGDMGGPEMAPQSPHLRSVPAKPCRSSTPRQLLGAPTWPPTAPKRSERPGAAGSLPLTPRRRGAPAKPGHPSILLAFDDGRRPGPAAERIHRPRGHGVPTGREPPVGRVVARLDVDPHIGQVAVDVQVEPRGRAGAVHAEADQGLRLFDRPGQPRGAGLTPRRQAGAIAIDRTDGTHQFATQVLTLPLPVLPDASFTLTVSVVVPFGPDAVFHGRDAGRSPLVSVATVVPLALMV